MPTKTFPRFLLAAALIAFAWTASSSLLVAQTGASALTPFAGLIDHASVNLSGWASTTSVDSGPHSISGDGRFVVMDSSAADLVPDDYNYDSDVFLRDRMLGATTRVSVDDDGGEAYGGSMMSSISANGRHVAFASSASNLAAGDTNGHWDVFVRDLDANRTVRISVASDGAESDADSARPIVSATGRFVVFLSTATTLAPGIQPSGPAQAYLHDRDADGNGVFDEPDGTTTSLVSVSASGEPANDRTEGARVSSDGRFVLFHSPATNLDPTVVAPNSADHLYLRDVQIGTMTMIDRAVTGGPSSYGIDSRSADLSDDGRFVTFSSMSQDIVWLDMNWTSQVFLYDTNQGPAGTTIVSRRPDGALGDGSGYSTSVTADGRYVAFVSTSTNLVSPPLSSNTVSVTVRDMTDGTFRRVDVIDGGIGFDHQYPYNPALSADGTAIAFTSNAQNAIDGMWAWGANHVFVATAFAVDPPSATVPAAGGSVVVDVDTTPVSRWRASAIDPWVSVDGSYHAGAYSFEYFVEPNTSGISRDGRIRVGSTYIRVHQDGDGDITPPVVTPSIAGAMGGDGWYVGSVTVEFGVTDPDSEIVSQSYGCGGVTMSGDAIYAPVTCEATSHGGTTSETVVIRMDNTPPEIAVAVPAPTVYAAGSTVRPSFTCTDASGYSGVDTCAIGEGSSPLDTTPGRHLFTVTSTDRAGNASIRSVEYLVGSGVCVPPDETLKAWWRFEGAPPDAYGNFSTRPAAGAALQYAPGVDGRSWQPQGDNYLAVDDGDRLLAGNGLTIAAWVRPTGSIGEAATIVSKPAQYRIARFPDGTLRWAFSQTTGFEWVNTEVVLPGDVWTHVAVTYDAGLVSTYVNGRRVHAQQLTGTLANAADTAAPLTIGARAGATSLYFGWIDELQYFAPALTDAAVESLALAGEAGVCTPAATSLVVSVLSDAPYGSPFPAKAALRDEAGNPLAGQAIVFSSYVSPGGTYAGGVAATTDAFGQAYVTLPMSLNITAGTYADAVTADFAGDAQHLKSHAASSVTVVRAPTSVTWAAPSGITYGTALNVAQLNATGSVPGTFSYSPAAGTVLAVGSHMLSVTFTPDDADRYAESSATQTLAVGPAPLTIVANAATKPYGAPLPAFSVTTSDFVNGDSLSSLSGVLSFATPATAASEVGRYPLTPGGVWSPNYSIRFLSGTLSVVPASTVTSAIASPNPSGFDQAVTLVATVAVIAPGSGAPTGAVEFYDGATLLGAAPLVGATATLTTNGFAAGAHSISATYGGDTRFAASSGAGTLTVNSSVNSSTTAVSSSANPSSVGQAVTLTATVSGPVAIAGSVEFYDGSTRIGTAVVSGTTARIATSALGAGGHAITARYLGSGALPPSTSAAFPQYVQTPGTKTRASSAALLATPSPASLGSNVTFTATVTGGGHQAPTGTVLFMLNGSPLGETALGPTGMTTSASALSTTSLPHGTHTVEAIYLGDEAFRASATKITVIVN